MSTGIEWTDETWNPTTGCDRVSPGCDNCYALGMAKRLKAMGQADYQTDGDPKTSGPGFGLRVQKHRINQPLGWRKPRKIFVNSMSDLFHASVPDDYLARVFAVMALAPRHTFQILTKRHARMRSLLNSESFKDQVAIEMINTSAARGLPWPPPLGLVWPRPNIWLGVSVENQQWADIRIPALLDTPAAVRFLSCEPLLGPVTLEPEWLQADHDTCTCSETAGCREIHWVIVGGESGPGARPMNPDWARSLRDQCQAAGVPYLFKQWGVWAPIPPAEAFPSDTVITPAGQTMRWADRDDLVPEAARRSWVLRHIGKHAAGRELDGRTWDQYPSAPALTTP